ncbi:putative nucleotidyltransferase, ribonuclease H [Tanacetum coccineum]
MEEMLYKFIDEGKREHKEMMAFICDFQTTNELLFKEMNNSLIELKFGVQELLKVINNVPMIDCDVKGVTTRCGKTTTQYVHDNNTNVQPEEPLVVELEKPVGLNKVLTNDQPQMTSEPVVQPTNETPTPPVPFPRRLRKEIEEAQHKLEEACKIIMKERCFCRILNKLPSKEKSMEYYKFREKYGTKQGAVLGLAGDGKKVIPVGCDEREEKSINQSDLECCESTSSNEKKPELKNLPQHLEYAYLHENKSFPIIISSELSKKEKIVHSYWMAGFFQIPIALRDQEKTTFTCPYGTFAYRRMPFGLCNAPATFQRCMTAIFHDMLEDFMEVFMDDFSVFGISFDCCLANLDRMLARCEETNLVLNWEKCHFMVKEGIVLGHKFSRAGIEVDRAKIDVIAKLPYPTNVKGVRSFLGHAGFYRRFIKDFSMISKPMTQLLMKDAKFDFSDDCKKAFNILKEKLTTAPRRQRINGKFKPIYYTSKTLNNAQEHYTTTEKELLAVVFSFDKFQAEILVADHLSRLENPYLGTFTDEEITDEFPNEHLMILKSELNSDEPWYADYDEPYAFKLCSDNVIRRCVAGNEILKILAHYHFGPTRGHHSESITGREVYESGFYWPSIFKDAKDYVMRCDACQRSGNISSKSEMPQNNIQIEHKAYWALKQCNMDLTAAAKNHFMELNELMEVQIQHNKDFQSASNAEDDICDFLS